MSDDNWTKLSGGQINNVWTNGPLVRRTLSEWSPAVHELLRFLNKSQVPLVPNLVKVDSEFEYHERLPGKSAFRPWPEAVRSPDWMVQIAKWLKTYHQAVANFSLSKGNQFVWGPPNNPKKDIPCHGDLGPWNFLHQDGTITGIIDWDLTRFGPKLDDLAQVAIQHVPFRPLSKDTIGIDTPKSVLEERLAALCSTYGGIKPNELVHHCIHYLQRIENETDALSRKGHPLFVEFVNKGDLQHFETVRGLIKDNWL